MDEPLRRCTHSLRIVVVGRPNLVQWTTHADSTESHSSCEGGLGNVHFFLECPASFICFLETSARAENEQSHKILR